MHTSSLNQGLIWVCMQPCDGQVCMVAYTCRMSLNTIGRLGNLLFLHVFLKLPINLTLKFKYHSKYMFIYQFQKSLKSKYQHIQIISLNIRFKCKSKHKDKSLRRL